MEKIYNQIDLETIQQLADIVKKNELSEITIVDGGKTITVKGKKCPPPPPQFAPMAQPATAVGTVQTAPQIVSDTPATKGKAIVSPIVGTFYSSPSPDKPAFVKVGDKINEGDVVCIVESMKVMNEIQAEFSGTVSEICLKSGDAVEFGQNLIIVE